MRLHVLLPLTLLAATGVGAVLLGWDDREPQVVPALQLDTVRDAATPAPSPPAERPAAATGAARTVDTTRDGRTAAPPPPRLAPLGAPDPVDRGGRRVTWSVDVEPATGLDVAEVSAIAEAALTDPRSWGATYELVRVAPGTGEVDVLVATPGTVDALCGRAGMDTNGIFSCWNGSTAALNLDRWQQGDPEFPDLATYRAYLVNHEVGHGLGRGHVECPGSGQPAPVMMQQSRTAQPCTANAWPYP